VIRLSLDEAARRVGDRPALIGAEWSLSYAELAARVARTQAWLTKLGIQPGSRQVVALTMHGDRTTVEHFWALLAMGVPLLTLHPRQRPEISSALIERTGAAALYPGTGAPEHLSATAPPAPELELGAVRLIVPTSGSSGEPKLVTLSERNLLASAQANWANLGMAPDERWLVCLPLAHVGGLSILTRSLVAGSAVVLFDAEGGLLARIRALAETLQRQQITLVSLVPTVLSALLDTGFRPPPSLRAVLLGGAATTPALLERARAAGVPVLPSYGLTEAASQLTTRRYERRLAPPTVQGGLAGSGHALPGVQVRLDSAGRIEVAGAMLSPGYWGEGSSLDAEGWLRTGDRGVLSDDGELVVLGRCDDLIVTGGENVDPLAVEAALAALPGLRAACVFGEGDEQWGELVAAALCFEPGSEPTPQELADFCARELAAHERVRRYALLPELPLTGSGKVDRRQARELARPRLRPL
jgi:o-succinylbenzoate---CoA ligase